MTHKEALVELLAKVEAGRIEHYHWSILGSAMPERTWSAVKSSYHGSLDATKALHEAVLPGWEAAISTMGHSEDKRDPVAMIFRPDDQLLVAEKYTFTENAATPARAWLIAILKALISEATDNGE